MNGHEHPAGHVLQAHADGELPTDEALAVDSHCAGCAACGEALAELREVQGWLAVDAPHEKPSPVWAAVAAATQKSAHRLFSPAFSLGAAAACAAGIVLGLLLGVPQGGQRASSGLTAWSSTATIWSGAAGGSMLDVYTGLSQEEGTDGS